MVRLPATPGLHWLVWWFARSSDLQCDFERCPEWRSYRTDRATLPVQAPLLPLPELLQELPWCGPPPGWTTAGRPIRSMSARATGAGGTATLAEAGQVGRRQNCPHQRRSAEGPARNRSTLRGGQGWPIVPKRRHCRKGPGQGSAEKVSCCTVCGPVRSWGRICGSRMEQA